MKIDLDVLHILQQGELRDEKYYLPQIQLERNLYSKVDKVLKCAGYKWNKKEKAHLPTQDNSQDILTTALKSGVIIDTKKEFQFFPTPPDVVEQMIEALPFRENVRILEPSAGTGAIAQAIREHCEKNLKQYTLDVIELNPQCQQVLQSKGFNLVGEDFLRFTPTLKYDLIVMNPPFSKQQDIDHVTHALSMLAPDGWLVSVMFPSFQWRTNKKTTAFKELINNFHNPDHYGNEVREIEAGAFKSSGTNISTLILFMYP